MVWQAECGTRILRVIHGRNRPPKIESREAVTDLSPRRVCEPWVNLTNNQRAAKRRQRPARIFLSDL